MITIKATAIHNGTPVIKTLEAEDEVLLTAEQIGQLAIETLQEACYGGCTPSETTLVITFRETIIDETISEDQTRLTLIRD